MVALKQKENNRPYHGFDAILTDEQGRFNYSVYRGIRWQNNLSKIEFYTIC